ncbi:MAG: FG-GAP repeat domain-containing protein [Gemmataceae bacterium]
MNVRIVWATVLWLGSVLAVGADEATPIRWKKTVVDKTFRSEGVAVADVNRNGLMDILVGDVWYEAPDWKMHPIRKVGDYGDGSKGYSESFACFADDINKDGYPDLIVIGFPGKPCHWYENPKGQATLWKEHVLWHSACNETPQYLDLFGTGQRVLIMATQPEGQMAWFAPGKDPTQPWELHPISEKSTQEHKIPGTDRFAHGLGAGDVNGDGRLDVIVPAGWWEQPAQVSDQPWTFHPANLGDACADMYAYDVDGDGKPDVISSSAHRIGLWAYLQRPGKEHPTFVKQDLFDNRFSQSHALHFVDINGDGLKDLVTGKRWWAHGPKGDINPNDPAVLYWFEAKKDKDGLTRFIPHQIDDDSGIGTQFVVTDVTGDKLPDIVVANKKGVFMFTRQR